MASARRCRCAPARGQRTRSDHSISHGRAIITKLSNSFSGALRTFAFWIANKSLGHPMLDGIDYSEIFNEPGAFEAMFAIFANVIQLDEEGNVLNAKWAEHRVAQWVLQYVTGKAADPPIEAWECALHDPPPKVDVLPWPSSKAM